MISVYLLLDSFMTVMKKIDNNNCFGYRFGYILYILRY